MTKKIKDPLVAKAKRSGEIKRFQRQKKAAKELGMDTKEKLDRPYSEPYKFTNSQRVNRRAMQQAESDKLQRAARKKQKASDTNQRFAQLAGDMVSSVVNTKKAAKNIKSSAQMATDKARAVLRRMSKNNRRMKKDETVERVGKEVLRRMKKDKK
mgnify:CR=1 FL=1